MTAETVPMWPQGLRLLAKIRAYALTAALSTWTPSLIAIFAVIGILATSGGLIVQARLAELAEARALAASAVSASTGPPVVAPLDFTLSPDAVRPISMDEARIWNAGIPFSTLPIQAARPFIMAPDKLADYARALDCLTAAVYYEAASETGPGQAAVAQVVLNRMRHPAFPKTVCGVVFQGQERTTGCQFSFTCDGALARLPSAAGWARARAVAASALNGSVAAEVGMATHYHTDWVAPYWAERLVKMRQIGTHIFYRWTGGWGLPGAFTGQHTGDEPIIEKLAGLATYVEELPPPLVDLVLTPLEVGPPIDLAPAPKIATEAPVPEPEPQVPVQTAVVSPPAPPPVMANPLAPVSVSAPTRRSRLAVPRN